MKKKKTLSIVGLGLIGGCYAKTLRDEFDTIYGIDLDEKALSYAESEGIIDKGFIDPKLPLSESDLVVICLYPNLVEEFIDKNKNNFKPNTIITDAVGVKGDLIDKILEKLPSGIDFVGAHPMAGKEVQGVWNSSKEIFNGANFIITPHPLNNEKNLDFIEMLAYKMGFKKISRITPEKHDEIISFTSQLTHAIAVALVNSDEKNFDTNVFIGDSYRDLTRIAMINEELWDKLFMGNKENLIKKIEKFEESLDIIKNSLKTGDSESLKEEFRKSTVRRKEIS
ncbi:MAG: prephenate dehydrogenase [Psychrilyobacter sp.]|uniref:prephenate dehydrogenase n=1 Tax=Psychrilyobacter sp. TaxID=2586924 RepID=UPI003C783ADD